MFPPTKIGEEPKILKRRGAENAEFLCKNVRGQISKLPNRL